MYGENCSKSCGNCKNSQQCHHISGSCMNGCEKGYQGLNCNKGISQKTNLHTCKNNGPRAFVLLEYVDQKLKIRDIKL